MAVDEDLVRRWIAGYLRAWRSLDRAEIEALFTEDATYRPQPDSDPVVGRSAIADTWIDEPDAGEWQAELEPMLVHDDTAIVTGWTDYTDGERFLNLWIVQLDAEGRCSAFTEWWMTRRN